MNPLDIVIVIIFCFCVIRGFFRGLIKEISSIIGVFVGYFLAYTYFEQAAEIIRKWEFIEDPSILNIVSFLCIFCAAFFVVSIIGVIIRYILKNIFLGWIDSTFGGVFGFVKATLISSVLLISLATFLPKESTLVKESFLAPHVNIVADKMIKMVPERFKNKFYDKMDEVKEFWNKKQA